MRKKIVGAWLIAGLIMIFIQVVIGGVTRLTGSGLSITKWEIVTGTIPPLSINEWNREFDHYKATPQYQKINEGMTLKEFKFIYFWEYFHRLWARLMGFVFIIPFGYFLARGYLSRKLIGQLGMVIFLAALVASFGWIMVQSGLINRPWVSPFKLTMHLSLAIILFVYLLIVTLKQLIPPKKYFVIPAEVKKYVPALIIVLVIQVLLGGMMSGMKAGLNYPTYPAMNGEWIPAALSFKYWSWQSFIEYDTSLFAVTFVQFFHRIFAILLLVMSIAFAYQLMIRSDTTFSRLSSVGLIGVVIFQFLLGVITVINSQGQIPVLWGVMHQAVAIVLITFIVTNIYLLNKTPKNEVDNI